MPGLFPNFVKHSPKKRIPTLVSKNQKKTEIKKFVGSNVEKVLNIYDKNAKTISAINIIAKLPT